MGENKRSRENSRETLRNDGGADGRSRRRSLDSPFHPCGAGSSPGDSGCYKLAEPTGLEPATSRVTG
ncbi:MAG: hypothetical protein KDD42_01700, partial [Bdellovibrionales bacterium]|nr:hypothetical protein [Bdellovibrionales bacterium]